VNGSAARAQGLERRLTEFARELATVHRTPYYTNRLKTELAANHAKGFAGYMAYRAD